MNRRRFGAGHGLPAPVFGPAFGQIERLGQAAGGIHLCPWVRGATRDPRFEKGDLIRRECGFRGHGFHRLAGAADGGDEEALVEIARDDRGPRVSTGFPSPFGVEQETSFLFAGRDGMAF